MNAETWFAALAALAVVNLALAIAALVRKRDDGTERIAGALREEIRASREDAAAQARQLREELGISQARAGELLLANIGRLGTAQKEQLDGLARAVHDSQQHTRTDLGGIRTEIQTRLQQIQTANESRFEHVRSTLTGELGRMQESQGKQIAEMIAALTRLTESSRQDQQAARELLEQRFVQIQASNEKKLEEMRQTVDEKLQGTLEKRLGESFRQVSERLEAVQRGLGEMKNLADGVGDLKRVLTNVKERGTWGEYQLAAILEQVLTPDQYAANVRPKEGGEVVEYAIRLPGRNADGDGAPVWLPIDAKFPKEDYERLLAASEAADADAVRTAMSALANAVKKSAKDIHDKYIAPPATTDFAILFLPTEGLYAEVLRMPGLHDELQQKFRVLAAGPTTLAAILNSLRVGFQTLAIEQRSHEVWNTLRAVKTEFGKFGDVLEKVKKQLATASNTIDVAQTRTRAMARKLKSVEQLGESEATALLGVLPEDAVDDNADEPEETP